MKTSFYEKLHQALQKEGYRSLRALYNNHAFSFSYEYLRQIASGEKTPSVKKVSEIAVALNLEEGPLQELAREARVARQVRRHYHLPAAAHVERFSEKMGEKVNRLRREIKEEERLLKMIKSLGEKEREDLKEYLKFLRQQWRKKEKKKK